VVVLLHGAAWEGDDRQGDKLTAVRCRQPREALMDTPTPTVIKVAAREVAAELQRQGINPDEQVTLTIEPELIPGRRESRKLVIAAGLTDDDIDALIKRAQPIPRHSDRGTGELREGCALIQPWSNETGSAIPPYRTTMGCCCETASPDLRSSCINPTAPTGTHSPCQPPPARPARAGPAPRRRDACPTGLPPTSTDR
jgi:hypothetical protein